MSQDFGFETYVESLREPDWLRKYQLKNASGEKCQVVNYQREYQNGYRCSSDWKYGMMEAHSNPGRESPGRG
jgi:hypothetical protein